MTKITNKLFNPAMAQALWEGRKTETRRLFKDAPGGAANFTRDDDGMWDCMLENGEIFPRHFGRRTRLGDLIWVKEAHYAYGHWRTIPDEFTAKTGKPAREFVRHTKMPITFEACHGVDADVTKDNVRGWHKRPSLFLSRADSRMTLRVTGFNIERLHDIDEAGAIAEGIERLHGGYHDDDDVYQNYGEGRDFGGFGAAVSSYRTLWNTINGDGAWDAKPWVSVTKFEVIKQNVLEIAN